jgi:hypothetical protein
MSTRPCLERQRSLMISCACINRINSDLTDLSSLNLSLFIISDPASIKFKQTFKFTSLLVAASSWINMFDGIIVCTRA